MSFTVDAVADLTAPPRPSARARADARPASSRTRPRRRWAVPTPSSGASAPALWINAWCLLSACGPTAGCPRRQKARRRTPPAAAASSPIKAAALGERRKSVRVRTVPSIGVRDAEEPPRAFVAVQRLRSPPARPPLTSSDCASAQAPRPAASFLGEVGVGGHARQVDARPRLFFVRVVFRKEEGVGRALAEPHACSCVGSPWAARIWLAVRTVVPTVSRWFIWSSRRWLG